MSYFLGSRLVTSTALVMIATVGNATIGATEARAQARAERALQIEEIMVTAQKREQGLQDVPVAVSALSSLYLDQRNIDNMDDIALVVPSFKFNAGTNDTFQGPTLRGVGTFGLASGLEPSVSFVVDGVVLARAAQGFFEFNDIERIEVLRGPQASLFGKNASAGVINVVSKAPSDTFEFEARANYEPETPGRLFKVSASASGPIVKDRLSARISGFYRDASPHITNVFNGERINGEEVFGIRGKFLFTPNENLDILLSGDYSEKDSNCCQQQLTQIAFPAVGFNAAPVVPSLTNREVNVNETPFEDVESWGLSLEANWSLKDNVLTSISAYREYTNENNFDADDTPFSAFNPRPGQFNLGEPAGLRKLKIEQFTQEVRLTSSGSRKVDYIVGAFYYYAKLGENLDQFFFVPPFQAMGFPAPTHLVAETKNEHISGFANATWHITDQFNLQGGLRVLYEDVQGSVVSPTVFAGAAEADDDDFNAAGNIVAQYFVSEDLNVYASYGRGYKGPGFDTGTGVNPGNFMAVQPETADAYEIGLKSYLLNRRVSLNLAAFWARYKDFQASAIPPGESVTIALNAGKLRTRGVELDLNTKITERLTFTGSVTYLDAEFLSFINAPCFAGQTVAQGCVGGTRTDLDGADLPKAPEWALSGSARYDQPLTQMPFDLYAVVSGTWQDDMFASTNANAGVTIPSYGVLDARVGIADDEGRYDVAFYVNNITDTNFFTTKFQFLNSSGSAASSSHLIPRDAERRIGFQATIRY